MKTFIKSSPLSIKQDIKDKFCDHYNDHSQDFFDYENLIDDHLMKLPVDKEAKKFLNSLNKDSLEEFSKEVLDEFKRKNTDWDEFEDDLNEDLADVYRTYGTDSEQDEWS